jgi:hypothetical protein
MAEMVHTEVDKRAAKFISRLPLRFKRTGTRMKSSGIRIKTSQCWKSDRCSTHGISFFGQRHLARVT